MAGLLAGGIGGAAKAGQQYTTEVISENLRAIRDERLAGIRKEEKLEEREYQKGVREEKTAAEEETYKRREAAEEKKYQRRLKEAEVKAAKKAADIAKTTKVQTIKVSDPNDPYGEREVAAERAADGSWKAIKVEGLEENFAEKPLTKSEKLLAKDRIMERRKASKDWHWRDPGDEEVETEAYKFRVQESIGQSAPAAKQPVVSKPVATQYTTKEEVRDAYQAGQVTREEAKKIISGMQ